MLTFHSCELVSFSRIEEGWILFLQYRRQFIMILQTDIVYETSNTRVLYDFEFWFTVKEFTSCGNDTPGALLGTLFN